MCVVFFFSVICVCVVACVRSLATESHATMEANRFFIDAIEVKRREELATTDDVLGSEFRSGSRYCRM